MNSVVFSIHKIELKLVFAALGLAGFMVLCVGVKTAKADSLSLSIPVPYMETVNNGRIRPIPNISFEIDLTSSLGQPTAGVFSVNSIDACTGVGGCFFTDSNGNILGPNPTIASIPASATYYYKIPMGGTATGLQELDFKLTPTGCGGSCPAVATAIAKINVLSNYTLGTARNFLSMSAETASATGPSLYESINNDGGADLNWSATTDQTWCHISAASGSVAGFDSGGVIISFDSPSAAGLTNGVYICTVHFTDQNGYWVYPYFGVKVYYYVTDSSSYKAWDDLSTCDAITINWNSFAGATGYNIYRTNDSSSGYSFASATKIQSNYQGLSYTDSAINLAIPSNTNGSQYVYWVEPIGTSDGPILVNKKPNPTTWPSYSQALRCGGPMMSGPNGGVSAGASTNGSGIGLYNSTGITNLGNAPLNWSGSASDPTCAIRGDVTVIAGVPTGVIQPGAGNYLSLNSTVGYNRPGNYSCNYTFSGTNAAAPYNTGSSSLRLSLFATLPLSSTILTDTSVCGQITIHWAPASDAKGYKIIRLQRGPAANHYLIYYTFNAEAADQIGNGSASPYPPSDAYTLIDTTPTPGVAYDYGIETSNGYVYNTGSLAFSEALVDFNPWPGTGTTATNCGSSIPAPTNVSLNNSVCRQMTINWNEANGGADSFNIYRNTNSTQPNVTDTLATGVTSNSYTDTTTPGSYYYWVSAIKGGNASSLVAAQNNPTSVVDCQASLANSDKDIIAVNGRQLYTNPNLPNGNPCNNQTDPLPPGTTFRVGDTVTFEINVCNNQGQGDATSIIVTDDLINLVQPDSGWSALYNGSPITPTASGTTPSQTLVFNLPGTVAKNTASKLVFSSKLAVPNNFSGYFMRFQNSFTINYRDASNQPASVSSYTPLFLFFNGNTSIPTILELP